MAYKIKDEYDNIIFISDIRTFNIPYKEELFMMSDIEFNQIENDIKRDHRMQKEWYDIINPEYSLLKFRLPP